MPLHQIPPPIRRWLYRVLAVLFTAAALPLLNIAPLRDHVAQAASTALGRQFEMRTLRLALLPRPAVTLEDGRMLENDGKTPFLVFNTARMSLGWFALLRGRAEFVDARIEGLALSLVSLPGGRLSVDDLLAREQASQRVQWQLDRIDLVGARMNWTGLDGKITRFTEVELHALNPEADDGAVTLEGRVSAPDWGGGLRIDSALKYDRSRHAAKLGRLQLGINVLTREWQDGKFQFAGDVTANTLPWGLSVVKVEANASAKRADQLWQLGVKTPALRFGEVGLATEALQATFSVKSPQRELSGDVEVARLAAEAQTGNLLADRAAIKLKLVDDAQNAMLQLQSPLRLDSWRKLELSNLRLEGNYRHKALPRGAIKLDLAGKASVDLSEEQFSLASRGHLDGAKLAVDVSVVDFVKPRYTFGIDLARLDLTPYLPVADPSPKTNANAPANWAWLADLTAQGELKLGELDVGRFRIFNAQTQLYAKDQKLTLDPLSADIYGGRLTGALTIDAKQIPQLHIRQQLKDMEIAALLTDTLGFDRVAGRGNLMLDLHTDASSVEQMRSGLTGRAELSLSRGAISGIDIGDTLRGLRANLARLTGDAVPADVRRSTRFSTLQASFNVKDGVAHSNDLQVSAPFVSLGGEGKIDIGQGKVDYRLLATVLGKSGIPELDGLQGISIPIAISGDITAPGYKVDASAVRARWAAPAASVKPAVPTKAKLP